MHISSFTLTQFTYFLASFYRFYHTICTTEQVVQLLYKQQLAHMGIVCRIWILYYIIVHYYCRALLHYTLCIRVNTVCVILFVSCIRLTTLLVPLSSSLLIFLLLFDIYSYFLVDYHLRVCLWLSWSRHSLLLYFISHISVSCAFNFFLPGICFLCCVL